MINRIRNREHEYDTNYIPLSSSYPKWEGCLSKVNNEIYSCFQQELGEDQILGEEEELCELGVPEWAQPKAHQHPQTEEKRGSPLTHELTLDR